jgi:hypothetical protein
VLAEIAGLIGGEDLKLPLIETFWKECFSLKETCLPGIF